MPGAVATRSPTQVEFRNRLLALDTSHTTNKIIKFACSKERVDVGLDEEALFRAHYESDTSPFSATGLRASHKSVT